MRRQDLNLRPPGYEPDELPTALLRDIQKVVPVTGLEPVQYRYREILSLLCLPFHHTGSLSAMVRIPQLHRRCQGFWQKTFKKTFVPFRRRRKLGKFVLRLYKKEPHGAAPRGPNGWDIGKLPRIMIRLFRPFVNGSLCRRTTSFAESGQLETICESHAFLFARTDVYAIL